jgi:hypothetical protein
LSALLVACVLCTPAEGVAAEDKTVDEILQCQLRTRPLTNSVRTIQLRSRDRAGVERRQRAKVYGGVSREGFRTLLIQFTHPEDLRGFTALITEREGANHMFVSPAGLPAVKQIRGAQGRQSLFGTDFSYEDVERLYGLAQPRETHKLGSREAAADGRPFWILETTPQEESGSGYERIVSVVDRETCVLLRAEMYDSGTEPRKILTADPESVWKESRVWVAHDLLLRDLRDGSETRMVIDDIDLDVEHQGIPFTPEELEEYKRTSGPSDPAP